MSDNVVHLDAYQGDLAEQLSQASEMAREGTLNAAFMVGLSTDGDLVTILSMDAVTGAQICGWVDVMKADVVDGIRRALVETEDE